MQLCFLNTLYVEGKDQNNVPYSLNYNYAACTD